MRQYLKVLLNIVLILALFEFSTACKHLHSQLQDDARGGSPNDLSDPASDDWNPIGPRDGGLGGSNDDVKPNPESVDQEVSGTGPEAQALEINISDPKYLPEIPSEGALDVPNNATDIIRGQDHVSYDLGNHRYSGMCIGSKCYGGYFPKGDKESGGYPSITLSGDENIDYSRNIGRKTSSADSSPSEGNGDSPLSDNKNSDEPPHPSRSGNYGEYRKHYRNFAELKADVEVNEQAHARELKNTFAEFRQSSAALNVEGLIRSYVSEHNHFVKNIESKQPLINALASEPKKNSQRTSLDSPEGRKVRLTKSYIKYTRLKVESGAGHEHSNLLLDFADTAVEIADRFYSDALKPEGDKAISTALMAADMALDFVPGVAFAKDTLSLIAGKNIITGETLSSFDRGLIVAGLFVPSTFSGTTKAMARASNVAKRMATALRQTKPVRSSTAIRESLTRGFDDVADVINDPGFRKLTADLETLPLNRKVRRIKPGRQDKIAIIGRKMDSDKGDGVNQIADYLRAKGHNVETFSGVNVSMDAKNELQTKLRKKQTDSADPNARLSPAELKTSEMYKENVAWAEKVRDQGYTVIEMAGHNDYFSPFYSMEKLKIFGY